MMHTAKRWRPVGNSSGLISISEWGFTAWFLGVLPLKSLWEERSLFGALRNTMWLQKERKKEMRELCPSISPLSWSERPHHLMGQMIFLNALYYWSSQSCSTLLWPERPSCTLQSTVIKQLQYFSSCYQEIVGAKFHALACVLLDCRRFTLNPKSNFT